MSNVFSVQVIITSGNLIEKLLKKKGEKNPVLVHTHLRGGGHVYFIYRVDDTKIVFPLNYIYLYNNFISTFINIGIIMLRVSSDTNIIKCRA